MIKDFTSLDYLLEGNPVQKRAYNVLVSNNIFETLHPFFPLLAGTIPLEIDIESSDLDICCFYPESNIFINYLQQHFSSFQNFNIIVKTVHDEECVIAGFFIDGFEIEIFGQNKPSDEQNAFRHMLIEAEILEKKGELFKQRIIELKKEGLKTEPAFARLLGLEGDPYKALLDIEKFIHDL